ncbi:aldose 1-epimerase-like [Temnothorax longispinosus]|uniref:aldose 1-epimerase-like n=1 Tax=Temnothorax longispinosus TaxID=300112 RepID=UPI003A996CF1
MSFGDTLIEEDGFGFVPRPPGIISEKSREIVRRYTLTNKHKAIVRLISWGASIQSIKVPNRDGKLADVVLGFDDMDGYLKNRYMGSIIGRVANCVSGDVFLLISICFTNYMKRILHPASGRFLEVYSNHPGLQVYTGNMLTEVYGKGGVSYRRHGGFALSPRNYSNTVNVGHFPSCMLYPGKIYMHDITYKFGVLSED